MTISPGVFFVCSPEIICLYNIWSDQLVMSSTKRLKVAYYKKLGREGGRAGSWSVWGMYSGKDQTLCNEPNYYSPHKPEFPLVLSLVSLLSTSAKELTPSSFTRPATFNS